MKKILAVALVSLMLTTQAGVDVSAATQAKGADSPAQTRADVERAGLGEKARVTVTMKDGTKRKGYVTERRDAEFILRDRETDAPTVIRYEDAARVHVDRGHSTARNTAIGVGIGAGAVIAVLAIIFASLDD
ncbi:MAG: hypothetical protein M3268_09365 [Acidobacteriota bacterium]|nr:hypothetical protein [Acidobacteriota bacterium]